MTWNRKGQDKGDKGKGESEMNSEPSKKKVCSKEES